MLSSAAQVSRIPRHEPAESKGYPPDFFCTATGVNIYVDGSRSPYLQAGLNIIREVAARRQDSILGAKLASIAAKSLGSPFFRLKGRKLLKAAAEHPEAVRLAGQAVAAFQKDPSKALNFAYRRAGEIQASLVDPESRTEALRGLAVSLATRRVKRTVLDTVLGIK